MDPSISRASGTCGFCPSDFRAGGSAARPGEAAGPATIVACTTAQAARVGRPGGVFGRGVFMDQIIRISPKDEGGVRGTDGRLEARDESISLHAGPGFRQTPGAEAPAGESHYGEVSRPKVS